MQPVESYAVVTGQMDDGIPQAIVGDLALQLSEVLEVIVAHIDQIAVAGGLTEVGNYVVAGIPVEYKNVVAGTRSEPQV